MQEPKNNPDEWVEGLHHVAAFRCVTTLHVHTDGGIRPRNPGGASGYAFCVTSPELSECEMMTWRAASPPHPSNTVNVAEGYAIIRAIHWLIQNGLNDKIVVLHSDSNTTVKTLNGEYRLKESATPLRRAILQPTMFMMGRYFPALTIKWIPRAENDIADGLATQALRNIGYWKSAERKKRKMPAPPVVTGLEPDHGHYGPALTYANFLHAQNVL